MERVIMVVVAIMFLLAACGDDNGSTVRVDGTGEEDGTRRDQEATTEETDEVGEETAETAESSVVDAGGEANDKDDTEESGTNPIFAGNVSVAEILEKSAEAMAGVTSFQIVGFSYNDTREDEYHIVEEIDIYMKLVMTGNDPQMFTQTNTTSNMEYYDIGRIDLYLKDGVMYYNELDYEDQWYSFKTTNSYGEIMEMFNVLEGEELHEYAGWDDSFELDIKDEYFLLTFNGDAEDFRIFIQGSSPIDMHYEKLFLPFEDLSGWGTYELMIHKDTFLIVGYVLQYELTSIEDDMETKYIGDFTYSGYNKFGEIEVPKEVLDNAEKISW